MMAQTPMEGLRAASAARGEDLCALVPTLRMAAVGLTLRADETADLVHDVLLQGLILGGNWDRRDLLPQLLSRMRNAFYTRTPLAGWTGPDMHDAPEEAVHAAQVFALPPHEREAAIIVALLGASIDQASGLCGCSRSVLRERLERAQRRLGGLSEVRASPVEDMVEDWLPA